MGRMNKIAHPDSGAHEGEAGGHREAHDRAVQNAPAVPLLLKERSKTKSEHLLTQGHSYLDVTYLFLSICFHV